MPARSMSGNFEQAKSAQVFYALHPRGQFRRRNDMQGFLQERLSRFGEISNRAKGDLQIRLTARKDRSEIILGFASYDIHTHSWMRGFKVSKMLRQPTCGH